MNFQIFDDGGYKSLLRQQDEKVCSCIVVCSNATKKKVVKNRNTRNRKMFDCEKCVRNASCVPFNVKVEGGYKNNKFSE